MPPGADSGVMSSSPVRHFCAAVVPSRMRASDLTRAWLCTMSLLAIVTSQVTCLQLETVAIPASAPKDSYLRLQCKYKLEPGESLYSVKWYKDGNEFYRYVPKDLPPAQAFELPGVDIDETNCTENSVTIGPITFLSSGRYRCEVSGEAPLFQTVSQHRDMVVVHIPNESPKIIGGRRRYHINEPVKLNCSFGKSRPAANLIWLVNGEEVDDKYLRGPNEEESEDGLFVASLGVEFKAQQKHFKNGDMKIKCIATIASMYNRTKEESIEGERLSRPPALESRDSAVVGDTRADRVQAGSNVKASISGWLIVLSIVCRIFFTIGNDNVR